MLYYIFILQVQYLIFNKNSSYIHIFLQRKLTPSAPPKSTTIWIKCLTKSLQSSWSQTSATHLTGPPSLFTNSSSPVSTRFYATKSHAFQSLYYIKHSVCNRDKDLDAYKGFYLIWDPTKSLKVLHRNLPSKHCNVLFNSFWVGWFWNRTGSSLKSPPHKNLTWGSVQFVCYPSNCLIVY